MSRRQTLFVEFRASGEMPTEDGYYYARLVKSERIEIVKLSDGFVYFAGCRERWPTPSFDWFGPVREVREAAGADYELELASAGGMK